MKKILLAIAALACAACLLAGCTGAPVSAAAPAGANSAAGTPATSGGDAEKLKVVATIFPPYDFVREIAGDAVELTMLLPPGAESHSFEPSPQDIITIQNCDVFLYTGGDSDAWIDEILASMDTSHMAVCAMMDMVEAKPEELVEGMEHDHDHHGDESDTHDEDHPDEHDHDDHGHDEHDHEEEPELDEHVWTSPKNAITIVEAICEVLSEADVQNAPAYRAGTDAYVAKLQQLDAAFEDAVANAARRTVVFGDRFPFRYLADAYGLKYYAAFPGCSTETEPSAATVAFLIDKVQQEEIPVVFHIEFSNQRMADTICADTGAQKRLLHSCHNVSKAEMDAGASYLGLMTQNAETLKEALQ